MATSGLSFPRSASSSNSGRSTNNREDRPAAQLWINVGVVRVLGEGEAAAQTFVPLAQGIPLDTMEDLPIRSENEFGQFTAARNGLKAKCIARGNKLAPGEDVIYSHPDMPFAIQIRRVKEAAQVSTAATSNPFSVDDLAL